MLRSDIIKKVMDIKRMSEEYKKRNDAVNLPNLITREVYQKGVLAMEVICGRYYNLEKRIEQQTIKRVLEDIDKKMKI